MDESVFNFWMLLELENRTVFQRRFYKCWVAYTFRWEKQLKKVVPDGSRFTSPKTPEKSMKITPVLGGIVSTSLGAFISVFGEEWMFNLRIFILLKASLKKSPPLQNF